MMVLVDIVRFIYYLNITQLSSEVVFYGVDVKSSKVSLFGFFLLRQAFGFLFSVKFVDPSYLIIGYQFVTASFGVIVYIII